MPSDPLSTYLAGAIGHQIVKSALLSVMLEHTARVDRTGKEYVDLRMLTIGTLPLGLDLLSMPFLYGREIVNYTKNYFHGRKFVKEALALKNGNDLTDLFIKYYPRCASLLEDDPDINCAT